MAIFDRQTRNWTIDLVNMILPRLESSRVFSVTQWLDQPTGIGKVVGSIPIANSDYFLSSHFRDIQLNVEQKSVLQVVFIE